MAHGHPPCGVHPQPDPLVSDHHGVPRAVLICPAAVAMGSVMQKADALNLLYFIDQQALFDQSVLIPFSFIYLRIVTVHLVSKQINSIQGVSSLLLAVSLCYATVCITSVQNLSHQS